MILECTYSAPAKGVVNLCHDWKGRVAAVTLADGTELAPPKGGKKWTMRPTAAERGAGELTRMIHVAPAAESLAGLFRTCDLLAVRGTGECFATSFREMFILCRSLRSVTGLDTHEGRDFRAMFFGCRSLTEAGPFDLSHGGPVDKDGMSVPRPGSLRMMFHGCESLPGIPRMKWPLIPGCIEDPFGGCPNITGHMKHEWLHESSGWMARPTASP